MNEHELRMKCISFAFQYIKYKEKHYKDGTYKTPYGVIQIAKDFECYIVNGK